jgi:hypothetical protein
MVSCDDLILDIDKVLDVVGWSNSKFKSICISIKGFYCFIVIDFLKELLQNCMFKNIVL